MNWKLCDGKARGNHLARAVVSASTVMVAVSLWFFVGLLLGGLPCGALSAGVFCALAWWYAR
jgi:hypothetical protein